MGKHRKLYIYVTLLIILLHSVIAINECQRVTDPSDIPCSIISTFKPADCNKEISFFQDNGTFLHTISWANSTPFCNSTFNISTPGTYIYNSSIETGIITVEGSKMFLIAILLIPLGLAFFFMVYSSHFKEDHPPLMWFFRLLAILMLPIEFVAANYVLNQNPNYTNLETLFDINILSNVLWVFFGIILIYVIIRITHIYQQKKRSDFDEGRL